MIKRKCKPRQRFRCVGTGGGASAPGKTVIVDEVVRRAARWETKIGPPRGWPIRSGRDQLIRIPRGFELSGEEVVLRKEGDRLIIEPASPQSLLEVLAALEPLGDEFPPVPDLRTESVDL